MSPPEKWSLAAVASIVETSSARLRLGFPFWMRPFVQRGVIGITLGRTIYLSPHLVERGEAEVLTLVRHELAHVRQVMRLGLWRFLFLYVREYIALRRKGLSSSAAYSEISFEREARAAEVDEADSARELV